MVKLTSELITEAAQTVNPCRERELNLRGYKFSQLENMGATLDQYDTLNMNDNDLKKIENFPFFQRLKVLYLSNNRVRKLSPDFVDNVPNLQELILTNNELKDLADIDLLSGLDKLEYLSLMGCPLTAVPNYRYYLIFKIPSLRVLDYRRVKQAEKVAAKRIFGGTSGTKLLKEMENTFVPGEELDNQISARQSGGLSDQDKMKIKEAILAASSLEEVERLQQQLQAGQERKKSIAQDDDDEEEMEE